MNPDKKVEKFISETKTEIRNGVKYTTYYVSRPIEPGDPYGGSIGVSRPIEPKDPLGGSIGSQSTTLEVINYVYNRK